MESVGCRDNLVLSDVHTFSRCETMPGEPFAISRFHLFVSENNFCCRCSKSQKRTRQERIITHETHVKRIKRSVDSELYDEYAFDDDGDFILKRRDACGRSECCNFSCSTLVKRNSEVNPGIIHSFSDNIRDIPSDIKLKEVNIENYNYSLQAARCSGHISGTTVDNAGKFAKTVTQNESRTNFSVCEQNDEQKSIVTSNTPEKSIEIVSKTADVQEHSEEAISCDEPGELHQVVRTDDKPGPSSLNQTDDDLEVSRKCSFSPSVKSAQETCYINIKHSLATPLYLVGEQVWQGALLLCDYLLHHYEMLHGCSVLDLGAGTGLTSIIAAMFADRVYCTDTGPSILTLAQHNIDSAIRNLTLPRSLCPIKVLDLDWCRGLQVSDVDSQYSLTEKDMLDIQGCCVLLAADVIYDNDLTDAFFTTVKQLLSCPPDKQLYIGLERRLVFTIEDLDVTSPGYNHFRQHLKDLLAMGDNSSDSNTVLRCEQISLDFPQYLQYDRTEQLELWKISSLHKGT